MTHKDCYDPLATYGLYVRNIIEKEKEKMIKINFNGTFINTLRWELDEIARDFVERTGFDLNIDIFEDRSVVRITKDDIVFEQETASLVFAITDVLNTGKLYIIDELLERGKIAPNEVRKMWGFQPTGKLEDISNLITDMTIKGATEEELARVIRDSMVIIDRVRWNAMMPKIITICGSMKFKKEQIQEIKRLTLEGYIVLSCPFDTKNNEKDFTEDQLDFFSRLHKQKIDISDAIFVVNPGNYIGQRTMEEIVYASKSGKEILYLER